MSVRVIYFKDRVEDVVKNVDVRGRVFLILGDGMCSRRELEYLNMVSRPICRDDSLDLEETELSRLYNVYRGIVLRFYADTECLATMCVNGLIRRIYRNAIEVYGSRNRTCTESIPKHVYDELFRCVSIVDTVMFIGFEDLWKPFPELAMLAKMFSRDVVAVCRCGSKFCSYIESLRGDELEHLGGF